MVMEAVPATGHTLVNEYTKDRSEVLNFANLVKTTFGSFNDALMTKEWGPDEPDILVESLVRGLP